MFDFFVNNSRLPSKRMHRAVRVSILYLVFPVFFLGRPFILFQFWMFVVAGIVLMEYKWIMVMLSIWTITLIVSTHNDET